MLWELFDILLRGLRLRCPCCGHGQLFKTTFRVHDHCSSCGERFEREPGQGFGAVYINLGLTLALVVTGFVVTQAITSLSTPQQLSILTPIAAIGPLVFYRLSTGLWTSIIFLGEGLYIPWPNHRRG